MVQMNISLTSIPQRQGMSWWCVPIENCSYMPIMTYRILPNTRASLNRRAPLNFSITYLKSVAQRST